MDFNIFKQAKRHLFFILMCLSAVLSGTLFSAAVSAGIDETQFNNDKKLFEKAVQLSVQQQWSQAEPIYRDLLSRNKQWPEPGNNLAILLFKTQRVDEAKKLLEQAVSSSPSYRITQQNRTQLYNYLATQAYDKALGSEQSVVIPELELIQTIEQSVKVIEKEVRVEVEKIVIQKEFIERPVVINDSEIDKDNIKNHIKQQLLGWSRAWSQGDFEYYIELYADNFLPSDARKSYAEWKNIRRARLKFTKDVIVEIDELRVFIEPQGEYALVEFIQNYHSNSYHDKVLKQMYMQYRENSWLILSERTIRKY